MENDKLTYCDIAKVWAVRTRFLTVRPKKTSRATNMSISENRDVQSQTICALNGHTVEVFCSKIVQILIRNSSRSFACIFLGCEGKEPLPHRTSPILVQRGILDGEREAREERIVECRDTVSGEEEHAFVILQESERDRYEGVTVEVMERSGLQENIRLVN